MTRFRPNFISQWHASWAAMQKFARLRDHEQIYSIYSGIPDYPAVDDVSRKRLDDLVRLAACEHLAWRSSVDNKEWLASSDTMWDPY